MATLGDNPIESVDEDALNRAGIARTLAAELRRIDASRGLPSANKATTPPTLDIPPVEFRYADLGDGNTVVFAHFKSDADPAPLFHGLPDDRCQCPHWGYVVAGKTTMRFADHEETYEAGDAFYAPPGHLPTVTAGTIVVEFSQSAELAKTDEVIGRNMQAGVQPL